MNIRLQYAGLRPQRESLLASLQETAQPPQILSQPRSIYFACAKSSAKSHLCQQTAKLRMRQLLLQARFLLCTTSHRCDQHDDTTEDTQAVHRAHDTIAEMIREANEIQFLHKCIQQGIKSLILTSPQSSLLYRPT